SRDRRAHHVEEVQQFLAGADHHAEEGDFRKRRAQALDLGTEFAAIERARYDGTAAIHAAGSVRMVVGKGGSQVELQRGVALVEIHRLRPRLEEGIDAALVEM